MLKNILFLSLALFLFFTPKSAYAADAIDMSMVPADTATTPDTSQTISFTGTIADIDNPPALAMGVMVDGSVLKICNFITSPGITCTGTGGPYSAGNHTFRVDVVDNLRNSFSKSINFVVKIPCSPTCTNVCGGEDDGCSTGNKCPLHNGVSCNDGNNCTKNDTCSGGSCSGTAYSCPAPTECQASNNCDGAGGCTIINKPSGPGSPCTADTYDCTDDFCDGAGVCIHPNSKAGTNCNDNKSCTTQDVCNGKGVCNGQVSCSTPPETQCHNAQGYCDQAGNCAYDPKTDGTFCESGVNCVAGRCSGGSCTQGSNVCGGIVPCGRLVDDPSTPWKENAPCQFCHLFVLLDSAMDFIALRLLPSLTILMFVIVGLFYAGAAFGVLPGGFQTFAKAKTMLTSLILGFIIIFVAFIIIGVFLKIIGLASWTTNIYQNWWTQGLFNINCQVP